MGSAGVVGGVAESATPLVDRVTDVVTPAATPSSAPLPLAPVAQAVTDTVHGLLSPAGATVGGLTSGAAGAQRGRRHPDAAAERPEQRRDREGRSLRRRVARPAPRSRPVRLRRRRLRRQDLHRRARRDRARRRRPRAFGSSTTTLASLLDRLGLAQHPAPALATSGPRDFAAGQPAADRLRSLFRRPRPARLLRRLDRLGRAPASPSASSWALLFSAAAFALQHFSRLRIPPVQWRQLAFSRSHRAAWLVPARDLTRTCRAPEAPGANRSMRRTDAKDIRSASARPDWGAWWSPSSCSACRAPASRVARPTRPRARRTGRPVAQQYGAGYDKPGGVGSVRTVQSAIFGSSAGSRAQEMAIRAVTAAVTRFQSAAGLAPTVSSVRPRRMRLRARRTSRSAGSRPSAYSPTDRRGFVPPPDEVDGARASARPGGRPLRPADAGCGDAGSAGPVESRPTAWSPPGQQLLTADRAQTEQRASTKPEDEQGKTDEQQSDAAAAPARRRTTSSPPRRPPSTPVRFSATGRRRCPAARGSRSARWRWAPACWREHCCREGATGWSAGPRFRSPRE